MNRYFEELFADFGMNEHEMMGNMIFRIGNNQMSYDHWRETLSEDERSFAHSLVKKVDEEFYHLLEAVSTKGMTAYEYHLFSEIMIYYITHDAEMGWALPNVGMLYGESVSRELQI